MRPLLISSTSSGFMISGGSAKVPTRSVRIVPEHCWDLSESPLSEAILQAVHPSALVENSSARHILLCWQ